MYCKNKQPSRKQADESEYLVDTGEILNKEAEQDPGNHPSSNLQYTPQEVVPSWT